MPAAEIRRFGWLVFPAVFESFHLFFWAAEIRFRAAADIVDRDTCVGAPPLSDIKTSIALSRRSRCCWSSLTTNARFDMRRILAPVQLFRLTDPNVLVYDLPS